MWDMPKHFFDRTSIHVLLAMKLEAHIVEWYTQKDSAYHRPAASQAGFVC